MQKTLLIAILFILLIHFSSALNFTFSCPSEAKINQEFILAITSQATETCDVKIFAYQDESSNIISEIKKEGQWTNPFYYLKEAFPSQKEFAIRITKAPGKRELCVRLRQTGKTSFTQQCTNITITESSENANPPNNESSNTNNSIKPKQPRAKTSNQTINPPPLSQPVIMQNTTSLPPANEKIILNPISLNSKDKVFITKEENKRLYIIYAFTALCIIIIILFALNKL